MKETRTEQLSASRRRVEARNWRPRNCVWELTLACNLQCRHCGSRAGRAREDELSTTEALRVVGELGELGCELLTLSGGEPTLREDWDRIAAAAVDRGIIVNMVTNGVYGGTRSATSIAGRCRDAGLSNVGVSIDGPERLHEQIRGTATFGRTMESISEFVAAGVKVGILVTVNSLNLPHLEELRDLAREAGATILRFQLGKPMGTLGDHPDLVIPPEVMPELMRRLAELKLAGGINVAVGDSIGYFGPHDRTLRGVGWRNRAESWHGCQAGMQALGIQSDGGVKGCLSLQARDGDLDPFVEGNLRETSLLELWHRPGVFAFNRDFTLDALSGGCRTCSKASVCRGGARCVSSALGFLSEDPYCAFRFQARAGLGAAVKISAATAAAALCISVGVPACTTAVSPERLDAAGDQTSSQTDLTLDTKPADTIDCTNVCCECDYGILPQEVAEACCNPPPGDDAVAPEYGMPPDAVSPDYGMPPDAVSPDYGMPPDAVSPDYGLPPDSVSMDYGLPPDAVSPDAVPADTIDCTGVCCDCEYGVIPDAIYKACCEKK